MSIHISAWNLCDGFTNPEANRVGIEDHILRAESDIAVFPEARAKEAQLADTTVNRFESEGYAIYDTDYDDADDRKDRHGLVVIARPELVRTNRIVTLAGRNAIMLSLQDGSEFLGVHLVDRTVLPGGVKSIGGERQRVAQLKDAMDLLVEEAAIAGDFNATHQAGFMPRSLRAAKPIANLLPSSDPNPDSKIPPLERIGSLAQRLTNMASGDALNVIIEHGFVDAAASNKPTMTKGPIRVQLDHIMVRSLEVIEPTTVVPVEDLSDHRQITATLL